MSAPQSSAPATRASSSRAAARRAARRPTRAAPSRRLPRPRRPCRSPAPLGRDRRSSAAIAAGSAAASMIPCAAGSRPRRRSIWSPTGPIMIRSASALDLNRSTSLCASRRGLRIHVAAVEGKRRLCAAHRPRRRIAGAPRAEHLVEREPGALEAHRAAGEVEPVGAHHGLAGHAARRGELRLEARRSRPRASSRSAGAGSRRRPPRVPTRRSPRARARRAAARRPGKM